MRRARIKATVTVPTRKKVETTATQDAKEPEIEAKLVTKNEEVPSKPVVEREEKSEHRSEAEIPNGVTELKTDGDKSNSEQQAEDVVTSKLQENESNKPEVLERSKSEQTAESLESPTKAPSSGPIKLSQNRSCFTKPTPRLDSSTRIRRNSIQGSGASASESEDDSRRITNPANSRVRNDSICSVQSVKESGVNNSQNNLVIKEKIVPKRRMLISESARKLAESRREFLLKHENKTPDRSKLTMYDLIYYNPVSNPMKPKDSGLARKVLLEPTSEDVQEEEEEEETVDDPSSAMPVPQVKVGPDGQLIVDEQSLVIEQTDAKRNREALAKEAIIDDDNTGSGFYKKRQKSKEWPKWETLKFYKALNTVGTDFLLMQSLFPKRTRQEIKLKFKKEEKVNRHLVEKALAYHQEFDTDMLEKSLATFEDSEREYISAQESKDNRKKARSERKRKSRIVASSIGEMDGSDDEEQSKEPSHDDTSEIDDSAGKLYKKSRLEKSPESTGDVNSPERQSSGSHSDSDTEIYHIRPTRSGRQPRVKKLQGPDRNSLDNSTVTSDQGDDVPSKAIAAPPDVTNEERNSEAIKIPEIGAVEPGSLVILSKESEDEPGKSVLQVYMVSSNITSEEQSSANMTPIDLSPELLATVTNKLSDAKSIDMKE